MTELELLQQMARDISHIKSDIEELREAALLPAEDRIRKDFADSVKTASEEYKEGKVTRVPAQNARDHLASL